MTKGEWDRMSWDELKAYWRELASKNKEAIDDSLGAAITEEKMPIFDRLENIEEEKNELKAHMWEVLNERKD